jgi:hypothetical protein
MAFSFSAGVAGALCFAADNGVDIGVAMLECVSASTLDQLFYGLEEVQSRSNDEEEMPAFCALCSVFLPFVFVCYAFRFP